MALVFRAGESVDLYVDGRRDTDARRLGTPPERVAQCRCDLLIGQGYGLQADATKFALNGDLTDVRLYRAPVRLAATTDRLPEHIESIFKTPPQSRAI